MMWKEFEMIAGYEVTFEDYSQYIEPMYMAVGDEITKKEFVKMVNKERFALKTERQILNKMKKLAKHLEETCDYYTDFDALHDFEELRREYRRRFWGNGHVEIVNGYTYPEIMKGCTYPKELVCYTQTWVPVSRIALVK